jgi:predicted HicB family RNase H-like nuclease
MAIAKKPERQPKATDQDRAARRFIAGSATPKAHKTPTTLRFDPGLLERIDAAARRRGISRSAWIQYTLSRALDEEVAVQS